MYSIILDIFFFALILFMGAEIIFLKDVIRGLGNVNGMLKDRVDELIKNDEVR